MPNNNYLRGVAFERRLVNEARAKGLVAARSAGSHSSVDVWVFDPINLELRMIQCKRHKKQQNPNLNNPFITVKWFYGIKAAQETQHLYDRGKHGKKAKNK